MLQTITLYLPLDVEDDPVASIAERLAEEIIERLYLTEGHQPLAVKQYRTHLEDALQAVWDYTSEAYQNEGLDDAGAHIREPQSGFAEALRSAQKHIANAEGIRRKCHAQFPPALRDYAAAAAQAVNDN